MLESPGRRPVDRSEPQPLARYVLAAFALLFVVLVVVFLGLFRSSRDVLREAERGRRLRELDAAASRLGGLFELARTNADSIANDPAVMAYLDATDEVARARAVPELRLERFTIKRDVRAVEIVKDEAEPRVAYRVEGFAPLPGPTDELALERPDPLVQLARARQHAGDVAAALVAGPGGSPRLRVATARGATGGVVLVELDAKDAIDAVRASSPNGHLALVDGDGQRASDLLADKDALALALRTDVKARTGDWAELEGESVVASVFVHAAVRAGSWRVVAEAPLTESALGITSEIRNTIIKAAAVVGALLAIALSIMRLQVREAASREREVAVRRNLDETAQNERFLQGLFDAITDVVVVQDASYRIIRANSVAKKIYGQDMIGRACYQVYRGQSSNAKCKNCPADATVLSRSPVHVTMRDPRNDQVWEIANYPVLDERGQVKAVVEHARNVTDTRRLEQQLVQSEKLSTLGEMAAGVAHEINNPIGVISMFAQLLSEEVKEQSDAYEKAKTIEQHAEHVGSIVKDLLRFARKSTGEHAPLDARAAVERALGILEHQKSLREVKVETQLPPEPCMVLGDEGPLAQVVLNLMVNAVQAMEGKGELTVSVARVAASDRAPGAPAGEGPAPTGERVWIQVRDTGPGIPEKNLRKIFEPFFTTKPAGLGTGLGLSVSFGIVSRDHRGTIWVKSEEGKGALFTVELPALL
jgi:signal transduction histidine kinase